MAEDTNFAFIESRVRARWDERLRSSASPAAEWDLLGAYLARVDCDKDFSSSVHEERLAFARHTLDRLLKRDGLEFARGHYARSVLVRRLRPQLLSTAAI